MGMARRSFLVAWKCAAVGAAEILECSEALRDAQGVQGVLVVHISSIYEKHGD
jgi:hypothetical protein